MCVCMYVCVYAAHIHIFCKHIFFAAHIRGNIADKLQPRNINVSFNNNSNVPIDVIIFTFYSDQLTIDVETGIVTK